MTAMRQFEQKQPDAAWSDEAVELMKRLWSAGESAGSIAPKIGKSRCAVIGKVRRLGLHRRATTLRAQPRSSGVMRPTSIADRRIITHPVQRTKHLAAPAHPARLLPPTEPDLQLLSQRGEASQGISSAGLIKSIIDLLPHHCRWPIGDPHEADFSFCGKDRKPNSPYCPDCHARAYAGVSTRRPGLPMRRAA